MVPSQSSPPADNSPSSNGSRNKRRKNKNKRHKKQQQQSQQRLDESQQDNQQLNNDVNVNDPDLHKYGDHDDNDHNQIEDCPLIKDEISTISRDNSNSCISGNINNNSNKDHNHDNSTSSGCTIDVENGHVAGHEESSTARPALDANRNQTIEHHEDSLENGRVSLSNIDDEQAVNLHVSNDSENSGLVNNMAIANDKGNVVVVEAAKPQSNAQEDESDRKKKLLRLKLREYKELRTRFESQESHMSALTDHMRQQANKIKELEGLILSTKKTCNQLEKLLQNEVACRTKCEQEKTILCQTVNRLKTQIGIYEKNKLINDELMRTINATLMERDTEVSMLKLKLTRLQTNQSINPPLNGLSPANESDRCQQDKKNPSKAFILAGRSNSEFSRSSPLRSTMIAECSTRSSVNQLRSIDNDSSVWASIPADLTPSRRPQLLEKSFQAIYNESKHNHQFNNNTSTPLARDKRYKTLPPKSIIKASDRNEQSIQMKNENGLCDTTTRPDDVIQRTSPTKPSSTVNLYQCQVTNLDDSSTSGNKSSSTTNSGTNQTITTSKLDQEPIIENQHCPESYSYNGPTVNDKNETKQLYETIGLPEVNDNDIKSITITVKENQNQSRGEFIRLAPTIQEPDARDSQLKSSEATTSQPPLTPSRKSSGLRRIFDKFRRSDSNASKTSDVFDNSSESTSTKSTSSPFKRGSNRATLVGLPGDGRAQMSPKQQKISFQTDKPFAEWDTDMIVEWLTMIGLSMYANQCRRWVKCGAHIMNATPAEVDKGLGITNHLHRKKLRLAISELNGDCDKVTKAAAKLDYLWIAKWLDDLGLPQYKEAFINARIDGRVLNYLTIEDLISLGVKSVLHHASIKSGIRVLRSANFDLQLLKRRATQEEIDEMNLMRQRINQINETVHQTASMSLRQAVSGADCGDQSRDKTPYSQNNGLALWTCHRVMEWLRLIDFAEFAPNLRGSGVHGGLLVFEDGFNFDTICCLLSIPLSRTLLRRHLSSYFDALIGKDLVAKKRAHSIELSHPHLNPFDEIKTPKKTALWPLTKLRSSSKISQSGMDDYLVPIYPMEPSIIKTTSNNAQANSINQRSQHPQQNNLAIHSTPLAKIPESVGKDF